MKWGVVLFYFILFERMKWGVVEDHKFNGQRPSRRLPRINEWGGFTSSNIFYILGG